jgi:hypothetical protein
MEFTKYEKRFLDPRFPRRNRVILIMAILLVAAALFVQAFGGRYTEKFRKPYQDMMFHAQKIVTHSQNEDTLKQSLIHTIEAAELGWYRYAESKRRGIFQFLLFFGGFMFVVYWQNMRIHSLLRKVTTAAPPNNSLQRMAYSPR